MYRTHKSATCCYCGTKTVLSLSDGKRHELKCSTCGAPLSKLKHLHQDHVVDRFNVGPKQKVVKPQYDRRKKKQKSKKRYSLAHRIFDIAEEIIDILD